ncbi:MAG: GNAT family N-acetyltransferase [Rhodospirillales bacterium]|nr:GNAT family N-acetyltransferase [Rhodospirillales bacterium]
MSANDVTFRPATRADARVIAELFQISSEGVADYVWSKIDDPEYADLDLVERGEKRYSREDVDFSYQNCDVAEIDGEPVGMLHAYVMGDDVGNAPDDMDPVLRPYAELEEPKSLYISGLALFDEYRGSGVGTRLLDFAYKRARAEGMKKISLICFEENEGACRLYQREGFKERARRTVVPHPLIRHGGDAILMVRED